MRYIQKGDAPHFVLEYISQRINAGQVVSYDDFGYKNDLNDVLREEQKHICCYCQQRVSIFRTNCHNEHLLPQHGQNARPDLQMEYTNIFASCSYSKGNKPKSQYCGEAKGNDPIHHFLALTECSTYFRYSVLGEILPNSHVYRTFEEFKNNLDLLDDRTKLAFNAIKILNLNVKHLMTEGKKIMDKMFRILNVVPIERLNNFAAHSSITAKHFIFVDMLLYFVNIKLDKIQSN
jgi:uncharacterized protein (TIGR02646 family)